MHEPNDLNRSPGLGNSGIEGGIGSGHGSSDRLLSVSLKRIEQ